MKKIEYKTVTKDFVNWNQLVEYLCEEGIDSWEMIYMEGYSINNEGSKRFIFKREITTIPDDY